MHPSQIHARERAKGNIRELVSPEGHDIERTEQHVQVGGLDHLTVQHLEALGRRRQLPMRRPIGTGPFVADSLLRGERGELLGEVLILAEPLAHLGAEYLTHRHADQVLGGRHEEDNSLE